MPSTQPDNANRETAAAAAALALLLANASRRYSLPQLIASAKIKPRKFRPIRPTSAIVSNMAAPHFAIVKAWQAALSDILAAVPLGRAAVAAAIEHAASRIGFTVMQSKTQFPRIVSQIEAWHRGQWISRVRGATTLDVSMLTQPQDVTESVQATTAWNGQLADDIHTQTKSRLTAALLVGGIAAADAKTKASDVITKARKRAAGIGDDQVNKTLRSMDRQRRIAASISEFLWLHTPQLHPRDWHEARNGQTFSEGDISADDRAGVPPFCKCYELPLL